MKKKILLVEDDVSVSHLYEHVLVDAGYDVVVAADGEEALELVEAGPDLVFLDVMLPKVDGMDVLRKLKSSDKTRHIPVIMLTNLGQESIVQEALKEGARSYQVKSQIDPYDLLGKVESVLGGISKDNLGKEIKLVEDI